MKLKYFAIIIVIILTVYSFYFAFLLFVTWPIGAFSLEKAGLLGESFGVLNTLFSGLALAGIVISLFIQNNELAQSHQRFEVTIENDKTISKLNVMACVVNEYNTRINELNDEISKNSLPLTDNKYHQVKELSKKKDAILKNMEQILQKLEDI